MLSLIFTLIFEKNFFSFSLPNKTRIEYDKRHLPLKIYNGDGQSEALVTSCLYTKEGKLKGEETIKESAKLII